MANWQYKTRRRSGGIAAAALISLALHLLVLVAVVPWLIPTDEPPPPEEREFSVVVEEDLPEEEVEAPPQPEPEPELAAREPEPIAPPEVPEEPKEEEEKKEEEPKLEQEDLNRKAVAQETNEEVPEEADFLSDEANKVEKQTRATDTALDDTKPNEKEKLEPEQQQKEQEEQEEQMAMREEPRPTQPEPQPSAREPAEETQKTEVEPGPGDVPVEQQEAQQATPKVDPRKLFQPDMNDYDRMFGQRDQEAKKRVPKREGRKLFENYEARDAAMRASLENFITEVEPGNHTGVNAHKSVYAGYLAAIHRKIHMRWASGYLHHLDMHARLGDPLNDPQLNTKLEFVIKASDGQVESVNIVRSSGQLQFDAEAVSVAHAIGPHPDPPQEIVSPDGRVYIHWNFWRDQRQCGSFGASVFIVGKDGQRKEG